MLRERFEGRRVLVTGHTGFKGAWLTCWLADMGADVFGFALAPEGPRSLYRDADVETVCHGTYGDIRILADLRRAVREARPDYVFHLAAQSLVRKSYEEPLATFDVNVMGTANLLESLRLEKVPSRVVIVTSDKCYENRGWVHGYRELDRMGGHDPYSASKALAELLVTSYRQSFFGTGDIRVATARAGNVIGGGDWASDRIVPDAMRALMAGRAIEVRNPASIRPWQHVLEPLRGYLLLAARLGDAGGAALCEGWNFGPNSEGTATVRRLVESLIEAWGKGEWVDVSQASAPHEAATLTLAVDKARTSLEWLPAWDLRRAAAATVDWYKAFDAGARGTALRTLTVAQITNYEEATVARGGR
ncbi:MAG: CDP-glucose 4,6-dehydratase [Polyangiaceae bacterium]